MEDNVQVRFNHVTKVFPGVKALNDVNFTINKGEVHGLVGENGAGKSTLIKTLMGVYAPTSGSVEVNCDGKWIQAKSPIEAKSLGLCASYQNVSIAVTLSIAENYFLGNLLRTKFGLVDWDRINSISKEVINKFKINAHPTDKIIDLPVALQEMVMISKISLYENLRVVIFDEPTALLEADKVEILFRFIRELKEKGVCVLYISHRLEEIEQICDRVTILKDGEYVTTRDARTISKDELIKHMVGHKLEDIYGISHNEPGVELLRIEGLTQKKKFSNINFNVHAGEIVGFFGLVGAGRTEVMRCVYGVDKFEEGKTFIHGIEYKIKNTSKALALGVGLVPEDRKQQGLAMELSVMSNINLAAWEGVSRFGLIDLQKERARADEFMNKLQIKTPSLFQKVQNLSGGNQQKVVVSKLLCRDLKVFIFDEPTVGIDVRAKQEMYKLIEELAAAGNGVVIISSYLPEVIGLSDRIFVMADGHITGEIDCKARQDISEESVLKLATNL